MTDVNKEEKKRTIQQNRAMHKYCEQLSKELNDAGISQKLLLEGLEIDNSADSIKSLFRSLGEAKYHKDSTAKFTTKEMSDIYEELNRHLAHLGVHVPWPSQEELSYKEILDN